MSKVPENSNFTSLKAFIPPPPGSAASYPAVYYSATPAEIVVFGGQPQWTAIPGTQLSYASNTGSAVFKYAPTGAYYFLTSGRWFTTTTPIVGAVDVRDLRPASGFCQDSTEQSCREGAGLGAGNAGSGRRRADRADPNHRDGEARGSERGQGFLRWPAAVPADRRYHDAVRGQHAQQSDSGRQRVLPVLSGRMVRLLQSAGAVAAGADRAAGHLHHSAQFTGVQRDLRDPGAGLRTARLRPATPPDTWERSSWAPRSAPSCAVARATITRRMCMEGFTTPTRPPTATTPGTAPTPGHTDGEVRPTDRTAAHIGERATTRPPEPTLAGPRSPLPYGSRSVGEAYNPYTGAYGRDSPGLERLWIVGTVGVQQER